MLSTRSDLFYAMPEQGRKEVMRGMIQATAVLNDEELRNIARTRARILAEFTAEKRKTLMGTHMVALMEFSMDKMARDLDAMFITVQDLDDQQRMAVMGTMKELMMGMPEQQRQMMMVHLPEEARKMLMA